MIQTPPYSSSNKRLIASKTIFVSAIFLFAVVILFIWVSGTGIHRSFFKNALLSTTIISATCFLFFSVTLFNGFKLKDNLGKIGDRFKWTKLSHWPDWGNTGGSEGHSYGSGDGILEIIGAIIIGVVAILFLVFLLWLLGNLIWAFGLFIAAALYWIFFRAVRFVLRHGPQCKGRFIKSLGYALTYTLLYSGTFYILILISYFMGQH